MHLQCRMEALLITLSLILSGCAIQPKQTAQGGPTKISEDKLMANLITKGKIFQAQKRADSLIAFKDPVSVEIGSYWSIVCWLYRDEPDSALVVLESNKGKWTSGIRKVHSEVFLNMARNESHVKTLLRQKSVDASKQLQDKNLPLKVEMLQQEVVRLRLEVGHLESERHKYQTLLKDLEEIH